MTIASLATDIIFSTMFFVFTMYGSIMGGSGKMKVAGDIDIQAGLGVANTERT
jgi:hypothetical protein